MSKKKFFMGVVLFVLFFVGVFGCSPKTTTTFKITGSITIDGKPIEQGSIQFAAVDGATPIGGGSISNGTYIANVPLGKKKVLVLGTKLAGQEAMYEDVPDSPMQDKYEQVTPSAYNSFEETPLDADISGTTKDLNFDLSSSIGAIE
ncbi:MAG: hypothetical protein LBQ66_12815 [Planctomycetaceae bacterium]|jgi:hypothetical protein|nr:hypothetical protein [Planctomycetaceae bacterium]